jgi:Transposase DDE domain
MFIREKRIGSYSYLYLVETVRENGKTKQRIIGNLGRKEVVEAGGDLDRLARSAARLSQRSMILSLIEDGSMPELTCRRIGAPLLFERLWQRSGCRAVVEGLLSARRFEFAVERAVFLTVLHRLMVSGSDRACEHWRDNYDVDGIDELQLHHLYRAMSWLGEELPETEQAARTLAPRCIKDLVEEQLFARQRDLFSELSVVFMDTTTLYFEGRGGATLGRRGHTKDDRPHLNQMVVGIIMDQHGRPVCSEMWPGNTADVTTLIPAIDRLRVRFAIGRVCVVADRGMISDATIAGLEERKLEYILGVRERSSKEVYEVVRNDQKPSVPLFIPRGQRRDTELEAKNVWAGCAL